MKVIVEYTDQDSTRDIQVLRSVIAQYVDAAFRMEYKPSLPELTYPEDASAANYEGGIQLCEPPTLTAEAVKEATEALEYLEQIANGHDYVDEEAVMRAADSVGYVLSNALPQQTRR